MIVLLDPSVPNDFGFANRCVPCLLLVYIMMQLFPFGFKITVVYKRETFKWRELDE